MNVRQRCEDSSWSTRYEKLRYSVVLCAGIFKDKEEYKGFKLPPMIIFRNLQKSTKRHLPSRNSNDRNERGNDDKSVDGRGIPRESAQ